MFKISTQFVLLTAAVFGCLLQRASSNCPNGWTTYEHSCYYFGHTDFDFNNAQVFCGHYNAKLVEIESANESNFLHSYLTDLKDPNHWIGLTDSIIEGEWRWHSDDSIVTFTDWFTSEPNNGKVYNCAIIYGPFHYQWADAPCNGKYRPLCEIDSTQQSVGTARVPASATSISVIHFTPSSSSQTEVIG